MAHFAEFAACQATHSEWGAIHSDSVEMACSLTCAMKEAAMIPFLIYVDEKPYQRPFDASYLPLEPLKHQLASNPLMFRVFTSTDKANDFLTYLARNVSKHYEARELTSADLRTLQKGGEASSEWACVDEQPWLKSPAGVGQPRKISELINAWFPEPLDS